MNKFKIHFLNTIWSDAIILESNGKYGFVDSASQFYYPMIKEYLDKNAVNITERKPGITGYTMPDGKILNLLAQGRLVNLAAGNGHPAEIMDISFALQATCLKYLAENGKNMKNGLYAVPFEIDRGVMASKLAAMGIKYDTLSPEQKKYLGV